MGKASGRNRQNFGDLVGERAMSLFRNFASGLRSLFRKNQVDRELDEELGAYLEMEAAEKMRQGVSRKDALREVRLERGTLEITKELVRSAGWEFFVETGWRDFDYSVRMVRNSPGFAGVAMVTLAIGSGANSAIFSLTDQILLRDLPVPHPEQLFILRSPGPNHGHTWGDVDQGAQSFSYPMYKDLRERATVFSGLLACRRITVNVSGHGQTQAAHADLISGNFFQTLEVQPVLGRLFASSDETAPGADTVAVLSYSYWSRQFGADPSILNKPLTVNGVPLTVVGVTRKGFFGVQIGLTPDLFIPVTMKAQMAPNPNQTLEDRTDRWLPVVGRLKPEMTVARAEARQREIGVRLAMGAKRIRLIRQLLTESLLIATAGGAAGVALAWWCL